MLLFFPEQCLPANVSSNFGTALKLCEMTSRENVSTSHVHTATLTLLAIERNLLDRNFSF